MPLASLRFLLCGLPLFLIGYYCMPVKGKQIYLCISSFLLYGWGNWSDLFFVTGYLCYDYIAGILIQKYRLHKPVASGILIFSVLLQSLILIQMRYRSPEAFPTGLAVRTLQGIGYLILIYRNRHPAEKNFFRLGGYLILFPVLVSYEIFAQQSENRRTDIISLSDGLSILIKGMAEKVVLADTFGYIFRQLRQISPQDMSMLTAWLMTVAFSMYLYFELLSYSEMARGLGTCVGYDLPKNFNHPFFTSSVTAFLQNWNMTLTSWFQGNFRNFLFADTNRKFFYHASFVLMGILIGAWYGTSVQFLIWGFLVGIFIVLDKLFLERFIRKHYAFGVIYTGILLQFLWVLFFSDSLSETGLYWKAMLGFGNGLTDRNGLYFFVSYIGLLLIGFYIATDLFRNIEERFSTVEIGKRMAFLKPIFQGMLFIFCIAFLLYQKQGDNEILFLLI